MNENLIMVKRSGPRGWHWIDRAKFDPAVHEEYKVSTEDEIELAKLEADEKAKAEADAAEAARIARESGKKGK